MPLTASMRNCTAAPAAAPPGTMREMALPASWAVMTENQALVRRAMRCKENVQTKWAPSDTRAGMNQNRARVCSWGQALKTLMTSGQHKIERHPGHGHHDRALDHRLPREGLVLLLVELGLERSGLRIAGGGRRVCHPFGLRFGMGTGIDPLVQPSPRQPAAVNMMLAPRMSPCSPLSIRFMT